MSFRSFTFSPRTTEALNLATDILAQQYMKNIRTHLPEGAKPLESGTTVASGRIEPQREVQELYDEAVRTMLWEIVTEKVQAKIGSQASVSYTTRVIDKKLGGTLLLDKVC